LAQVDDDYIVDPSAKYKRLALDFVVYTGRLDHLSSPQQFEQLRRVMVHAPHGRRAVGILGNHGLRFRLAGCPRCGRVSKIVRAAGVTVLRNEALTSQGCSSLDSTTCGGRDSIPWTCSRREDRGFHGGVCHTLMPQTRGLGRYRLDPCRTYASGASVSRRPAATAFASKKQALTGGAIRLSGNRACTLAGALGICPGTLQCASGNPIFQLRRAW